MPPHTGHWGVVRFRGLNAMAFKAAKNALVHANERAQQAVAALLSAARLAQAALLRLEALVAKGY
jgi:hypothetical protein